MLTESEKNIYPEARALKEEFPHRKVIDETNNAIFNLYFLGNFAKEKSDEIENLELVELQPNSVYRAHLHRNSHATIYIVSGTGKFRLGSAWVNYGPKKRIEVPAGVFHGFKTVEKTLFLSIQSPSIIDVNTGHIDLVYESTEE